ncbi:hypothetical protein ROHU_026148 [Labeo rohita]|uniref:Uncharacterized protein n=1 Tax=Labeo rohita TaxID=84645 RepID=A0A498MC74_LABRO|nr:hypothetical protein ROHU_026148 [Labeo rohita]
MQIRISVPWTVHLPDDFSTVQSTGIVEAICDFRTMDSKVTTETISGFSTMDSATVTEARGKIVILLGEDLSQDWHLFPSFLSH